MKIRLTISLLFGVIAVAMAGSYEDGNEAYANGQYEEAAAHYESALEEVQDPDLYYNLGNALYKTGDFARAILNYERALRLRPRDVDVHHNLEIARLQVTDKIEATPEFFLLTWWKRGAQWLPSCRWAVLFLIALWLSISGFLLFAFYGGGFRKTAFFGGLVSMIVAISLLLLAVTRYRAETLGQQAIILSPSVSVKSAPLNSGTDLFIIHEGLKVSILEQSDAWIRISLSDGKEGWIPAAMMEAI